MTRRLFPDDPSVLLADRYGYLRSGANVEVLFTTDDAGTQLADLIVAGVGVPAGRVRANSAGLLPDFYGPDGTPDGPSRLYTWIAGESAGWVDAKSAAAIGGPAGFEHEQTTPSATWTVDHLMTRRPGVQVVIGGVVTYPRIEHPSSTRVVATFPAPVAGRLIGS